MKGLTDMEKQTIRQKAFDLLKKYNIDATNGVDVLSLAQKMEFVVGNADIDDNEDGFILVNEDVKEILGVKTKKLIGVNVKRDLSEKRFIIAHELGHYILHCQGDRIYAWRESKHGRSDDENDVDYFAACLLMPEHEFIAKYNELKSAGNLDQIKIASRLEDIFRVPCLSILRRFEELELS